MPLFEYECQRCVQRFEYLVRSASDTPRCPHCGSALLRKLISGFAFRSPGRSSSSSSCSGCSGGDCSSCHH